MFSLFLLERCATDVQLATMVIHESLATPAGHVSAMITVLIKLVDLGVTKLLVNV
jgi:hypothetical protein